MTRMLPKMLLLVAAAGLLAGCPSYGPHSLLNNASRDRALAFRGLRGSAAEREAYAGTGLWGGSRSSSKLVGPPIYSGQTYYGATGIVAAPGGYGGYSSGSSYRASPGYSYPSSGGYYYSSGPGASYGRYFQTYSTGGSYYGSGTIGVYPHGGHGRPGHGGHGGNDGYSWRDRHPWHRGHGGGKRPAGSSGAPAQESTSLLQVRVGIGRQ
jgi:hypothetical protein